MLILAKTRVKDALKEYPELKDFLATLSPKFKKLKNPMIFRIIGQWATFSDVAKLGNFSICEILHKVNRFIGKEDELLEKAPNCIKENMLEPEVEKKEKPKWIDKAKQVVLLDVRERDDFFLPEVLSSIKRLEENQVLLIINSFNPTPLVNMLKESGDSFYLEEVKDDEFKLYIKRAPKKSDENWIERKNEFDEIDVRGWDEDPFTAILKKANETPEGDGFKIIQYFKPTPLINMIEPLGFETYVDKVSPIEHHVYFYKKRADKKSKKRYSGRIPLTIQSATPVVYPIIMRLLQSKKLMDKIRLEELKIWDKTEKHLGWILSGKADISFSAVAAVAKIYQKGLDIKMKAVAVWDNFFILTRGYRAKTFADLKRHKIYLPLVKAAPPYAVTSFLMKVLGEKVDDFEFVFGEPFGRPGEIKNMLVSGEIDTALLREPEASFAIFEGKGDIVESIAYRDIWEKLFPEKGNLPNAGVLFKGEILKEYPEIAQIFLEETKKAIEWINKNPGESANISYDIMGVVPDEVKLFLSRVHFEYGASENVLDKITHYIDVLNKAGYGKKEFGDLKELFM